MKWCAAEPGDFPDSEFVRLVIEGKRVWVHDKGDAHTSGGAPIVIDEEVIVTPAALRLASDLLAGRAEAARSGVRVADRRTAKTVKETAGTAKKAAVKKAAVKKTAKTATAGKKAAVKKKAAKAN